MRYISRFIPQSLREYRRGLSILKRKNPDFRIPGSFSKCHIAITTNGPENIVFAKQFKRMCKTMDIKDGFYVYPFDTWTVRIMPQTTHFIVSVTADYGTVLSSKLRDIQQNIKCDDSNFHGSICETINGITIVKQKVVKNLKKKNDARSIELLTYFERLLDSEPECFDEALQKILFFNALFWQAGHMHVGLGRLDFILNKYYERDIVEGRLTRDKAKSLIKEFCYSLHRDVVAKSGVLVGDTGQYILLGGIDDNGCNIHNAITDLFLEVIAEIKLPDPKLILRTNNQTPDAIWNLSVDCLTTGIGSPLILNEKRIMDGMVEFGYQSSDVWNFGTSACWEPLIIGKSFDQNNLLPNIPIINCINDLVCSPTTDYTTFEDFLDALLPIVGDYVRQHTYDAVSDCSPLYSLFFDDCLVKEKDFSRGGAKYAYHGVQIVSFPNTINALLNIKHYVYEKKMFALDDCKNAIRNNYNGYEDMRNLFLSNVIAYGANVPEVVCLTNLLMTYISNVCSSLTINGEKIKVGYSSSEFITQSKKIKATLDGRRDYEPFAVHISPVSQKIDIQEVFDFAASLDYSGNKMNGNVVDFIIPTAYAKNKDKLIAILKDAIRKGVYELQLNVLDKQTLVDAKAHPEKYPNQIGRAHV